MGTMPRFGTDPMTLAREWIKQQQASNQQDRKTTDNIKFQTAKSLTEPEAARRKQEAINSATMSGAEAAQEKGLSYSGGKTGTARRYGGGTGTASVGKSASAFEKGLRDGGVNNPFGIAAAMGHAQMESGFDTSASGDSGTAIGGMQWRGPRRAGLAKFAQENKLDINDPYTHGRYAAQEMQTTEKFAGNRILNARSLAEANEGMVSYLRPKGAEGGMAKVHNGAGRQAASEAWYKKISGDKTGVGLVADVSQPDGAKVQYFSSKDFEMFQGNQPEEAALWKMDPERPTQKGRIAYVKLPTSPVGTAPVDTSSGDPKVVVVAQKEDDDDDDFDPTTGE